MEQNGGRQNRFARHKAVTATAIVIVSLLLVELACYLVIIGLGNNGPRSTYAYNRVISGYTVYRQTPHFDFGPSTIKNSSDEPDVALDANGFICDEKIEFNRPERVVRIFVMGGSTALGAGQTDGFQAVHPYPWGVYSYQASIAGQLKFWLQSRFPGMHFQVVTAAAFSRKLHQSFLEYAANVSQFSPDIVISCDGMNDLESIVTGTPYADAEADLPKYIDLWNNHYRRPWLARTNTYRVMEKLARRAGVDKLAESHSHSGRSLAAATREAYQPNRMRFIEHADRFLQILQQFRATVESDGAAYLFCLQPLLHRQGKNKPLSGIETDFDQLVLTHGLPPQKIADMDQVNRYFFDDYLCGELSQVLNGDEQFIDLNAHLREIDASVEFYTDYCHLTAEGNRLTAEIIGRQLALHFAAGWDAGNTRNSN